MTRPTKAILACDEAGAKGHADRDESAPGETGVFAGMLIPGDREDALRPIFQAIVDAYRPANGKLHITDLPPEKQGTLRYDVYAAIRASELPCFWYAIHVAGFHNWYKHVQTTVQAARDTVAALGQSSHIKRGSPRSEPPSLHVALFEGLYGNFLAYLEERARREVDLEVRTDYVDRPIADEFEAAAQDLLRSDPVVETVTAFDSLTQHVVRRDVTITAHYPPKFAPQVRVRTLHINWNATKDGFVLAADVLANSLNYLFKTRDEPGRFTPLNTRDAIARHPLADQLDAFHDWGTGDLVGDRLYRPPKDPSA